MAEILGPALNLRLYESPQGFDASGLISDLGYFIREHGPSVVGSLLPQIPHELLTRLQYAPDRFDYVLIDGKLIAGEDLKIGRLADAQSRVDSREPERGAGAFAILGRIRESLADATACPDGSILLWISPKENFSPHAYFNIGVVGRDDQNRRRLSVTAYMNDFSQPRLLNLVEAMSGAKIDSRTHPRLVSRMLFSGHTADFVDTCQNVLGHNAQINGVPISILYGAQSLTVWKKIRQVVSNAKRSIYEIVQEAKDKADKMQAGMAQIVFGLIQSTLSAFDENQPLPTTNQIKLPDLLHAFAQTLAGCVGIGSLGLNQVGAAEVAIGIGDRDWVYCPVCDPNKEKGKVYCPPGHTCCHCGTLRQCG